MGPLRYESSQPASEASPSSRERLLDAAGLDAARMWTKHLLEELSREGRAVEGGWPGTVNEARGRCDTVAARALAAQGMPAIACEELGRVTRIAYDEARRLWRARDRSGT